MSAAFNTSPFYIAYGYSYFGHCNLKILIDSLISEFFSCNSSNVHEEAMLDIGALAYATGPDFLKYMPEFHRYLDMGLQNCGAYLWVWLLTSGVPWMKMYSLTVMVSWAPFSRTFQAQSFTVLSTR